MLMAGAAAASMGPLVIRYYSSDDYDERRLLRELLQRGINIDGDRREDQAVRIINQLEQAFNRKSTRNASHG